MPSSLLAFRYLKKINKVGACETKRKFCINMMMVMMMIMTTKMDFKDDDRES